MNILRIVQEKYLNQVMKRSEKPLIELTSVYPKDR
jgi:hypothetical protein